MRGAKQRWHMQGSPVYLSPSCWSPMTVTLPKNRRVKSVNPSAHGRKIASLVLGFGPIYYPPHQKQKMKKHDIPAPVDASKMCPLEVYYDGDIHDAVANLRKFDGTIPEHHHYGVPVNFFAPRDRVSTGQRLLHLNWGDSLINVFALFQL